MDRDEAIDVNAKRRGGREMFAQWLRDGCLSNRTNGRGKIRGQAIQRLPGR